MKGLSGDENAVSVPIGFILTFSITVLVLVVTLTSFYSMMDQAEQTVMRDEFEIHGSDIAVRIAAIDTTVAIAEDAGSGIQEISYRLSLPDRIAGKEYSIEFSNITNDIIIASEERDETRVKVPYSTEDTTVTPTTLYSSKGEYLIVYNPITNTIDIS
ncbi:DUF7266 family protein [Methanolobus halotolerans]|uniref:Uncharacterized protein n=1 Tax=Methanolobus halotolerans TaxID=2052935 RepID=A0A4E0PSV3_9EURY|nr:hypothetical protein [Methanolobus halotolerans]TGC07298.1 hypothetical protein CUN85_11635 [Methanolobus halotolerans]